MSEKATEQPAALNDAEGDEPSSDVSVENAPGVSDKAAKKALKKAKKQARPKMPKFMVFLMVIFVINFVLTIANLVFTSRDLVDYSSAQLVDWLNIVFEMVALWMLWCRFKATRHFVMCFSAFNITVGFLRTFVFFDKSSVIVVDGSPDFALTAIFFVILSIFDVVLFFYFWRSKKTKAYLTEPFGIDRDSALGEYEELKINRRSWVFWRNIAIYYCFFSLAGHWMESGFCMLIRMGLVQGEIDLNNTMLWRDWFYPFPMEGLAVAIIAVLLYPLFVKLRDHIKVPGVAYAVSFVINGIVCVTIEYVMGMFVNADLQLWDYSNMPFNLNGMICLQNGLGFALAASIICWIVYPLLERLFAKIPKNVMNLVFVIVLAAYSIPQALYLVDPPIPYKQQLEEVLASDSLDEDDRAYYQGELDKLIALQEKGVTLAGADGDE